MEEGESVSVMGQRQPLRGHNGGTETFVVLSSSISPKCYEFVLHHFLRKAGRVKVHLSLDGVRPNVIRCSALPINLGHKFKSRREGET
jgi:hypothetical protein